MSESDKIVIEPGELDRIENKRPDSINDTIAKEQSSPGTSDELARKPDILSISAADVGQDNMDTSSIGWAVLLAGVAAVVMIGMFIWFALQPDEQAAHLASGRTPYVHVLIEDLSETPLLTDAELYLTAESSNAYEKLRILTP